MLPSEFPITEQSSVPLFLRYARRCQRAVASDSPSAALPVLRRLIRAGAISETSLPALFRRRHQLQRKHFLRLLALEAGFASWEVFRPVLEQSPDFASVQQLEAGTAQLKLWFSDLPSAKEYVAAEGGQVIPFGGQAAVIHHHHA